MRVITAFGRVDWQNIRRDSMLLYILLLPLAVLLALRLTLPPVTAWLLGSYNFDLTQYNFLIVTLFILLQTPFVFGLIIGLMVLDERDAGTLDVLLVMPLPLSSYFGYRLVLAIGLAALYITALVPLTGLVDPGVALRMLPVTLLAALQASFGALALPAFARTKVEGLALMKGLGIFLMGPIVAYFVAMPWQWLFGLLPSYWPARAFWGVLEGRIPWPELLIGTLYFVLLDLLLLRRLRQRLFGG